MPIQIQFKVAEEAIRCFNNTPRNAEKDWWVHSCFGSIDTGLDPHSVVGRVFILNKTFSTYLSVKRGMLSAVARKLGTNEVSQSISAALSTLGQNDLMQNPEKVISVATTSLPPIMASSVNRVNYSFATKYLHWCTRNHFPMMDQYSRRALYKLQENGIEKSRPVTMAECLAEYQYWVTAASRRINEDMNEDEWRRLETVDQEMLHETGFPIVHTRLRLLDKVLYQLGKDEAGHS